jgi:hypothetical protein
MFRICIHTHIHTHTYSPVSFFSQTPQEVLNSPLGKNKSPFFTDEVLPPPSPTTIEINPTLMGRGSNSKRNKILQRKEKKWKGMHL